MFEHSVLQILSLHLPPVSPHHSPVPPMSFACIQPCCCISASLPLFISYAMNSPLQCSSDHRKRFKGRCRAKVRLVRFGQSEAVRRRGNDKRESWGLASTTFCMVKYRLHKFSVTFRCNEILESHSFLNYDV